MFTLRDESARFFGWRAVITRVCGWTSYLSFPYILKQNKIARLQRKSKGELDSISPHRETKNFLSASIKSELVSASFEPNSRRGRKNPALLTTPPPLETTKASRILKDYLLRRAKMLRPPLAGSSCDLSFPYKSWPVSTGIEKVTTTDHKTYRKLPTLRFSPTS